MKSNNSYLKMLQKAIDLSKELKMPDLQWDSIEIKYQDKTNIKNIWDTVDGDLFDTIDLLFRPHPYLGNMCLDLASTVFMYLKAKNLDVEMIYGNVNIRKSPDDLFNTNPYILKNEYVNKVNKGVQDIHAWVGLGGNIIVDFALPYRLIKNHEYSEKDLFFIGPADSFKERLEIEYKPMLIGSDFFKKTNAYDPLDDRFNFKNMFDKKY